MDRSQWVWMPHPGHYILSRECRFFLSTYVGKYLVSTIGERVPSSETRDILAESRGITLECKGESREDEWIIKNGYEPLGVSGQTYESMVFVAKKSTKKCCPFKMKSGREEAAEYYRNSAEAIKGHYRLCKEWSQK